MNMNKIQFEKYIRGDNQVAVLYSPGYGAGWYTWNKDNEGLIFDKEIVQAVIDKDFKLADKIATEKYNAFTGGVHDLEIKWMAVGTQFKINEYDGSESLDIIGQTEYLTA